MAYSQQSQTSSLNSGISQPESSGTALAAPQLRGNAAAREAMGSAHVVERGDTLSGIAASHLGSAARWPEIYEANQEIIGPDPDVLMLGQRLTLPAAGPGAITDAEVSAWLQPELASSELADLAECEEEKPDSLMERGKEILVGIVHDALGVQVANAPGPDTCIEPSRSEVEVVIDQTLTIVPVTKGPKLLVWGYKVAKAGFKKLVEWIGL